ncbi:MAG: 50S ribosomal protein L23 [Bacteroidetes bacterium]|nr:MAG: 50S ribosomal protein L23 [Bacteroidota bacterium]
MSRISRILVRPLVTEKMNRLEGRPPKKGKVQLNQYGFIVDRSANRIEIRRAVEEYYGVTVVRVNTMNYMGKRRTRYTKTGLLSGRTKAFKKAIVTLKEGDSIDFYSNI